ncbi:MAG: hypothetical protein V4669_15230 [Pseudomonadota bacterium]
MLATATRNHAPSQNVFIGSPVDRYSYPQRLTRDFLVALRDFGLGRIPGRRPDWQTNPGDQPDLDGLAADVWAALESRELVLDVPAADARLILGMPLGTWEVVRQLFQDSGGTGPAHARFGIELAEGSATMAQGLRLLGVQDIELPAPVNSSAMHFNASRVTSDLNDAPWQPHLTVICTEAGTSLKDIYVNDGAVVDGYGLDGLDVMVHHTDEQGYVLRSMPLEVVPVERSPMDLLFEDLAQSMRGRVLDLSGWTGERAEAVLKLSQSDWTYFRASLWKDVLDLVLVGPELATPTPLVQGVNQLCTLDIGEEVEDTSTSCPEPPSRWSSEDSVQRAACASRDTFVRLMHAVTPDLDADALHKRLLECIDEETRTTLDLSSCPKEVADVLRTLTPAAWHAWLKHPEATHVELMLMSEDLFRGGLLPVGVAQFLA